MRHPRAEFIQQCILHHAQKAISVFYADLNSHDLSILKREMLNQSESIINDIKVEYSNALKNLSRKSNVEKKMFYDFKNLIKEDYKMNKVGLANNYYPEEVIKCQCQMLFENLEMLVKNTTDGMKKCHNRSLSYRKDSKHKMRKHVMRAITKLQILTGRGGFYNDSHPEFDEHIKMIKDEANKTFLTAIKQINNTSKNYTVKIDESYKCLQNNYNRYFFGQERQYTRNQCVEEPLKVDSIPINTGDIGDGYPRPIQIIRPSSMFIEENPFLSKFFPELAIFDSVETDTTETSQQ